MRKPTHVIRSAVAISILSFAFITPATYADDETCPRSLLDAIAAMGVIPKSVEIVCVLPGLESITSWEELKVKIANLVTVLATEREHLLAIDPGTISFGAPELDRNPAAHRAILEIKTQMDNAQKTKRFVLRYLSAGGSPYSLTQAKSGDGLELNIMVVLGKRNDSGKIQGPDARSSNFIPPWLENLKDAGDAFYDVLGKPAGPGPYDGRK